MFHWSIASYRVLFFQKYLTDAIIIKPPMTHGMFKRPDICRSVLCGYPVWWILYPKKNSSSHAPVFQTKKQSASQQNQSDTKYNHHAAPFDFLRRRLVGVRCCKFPLIFAHPDHLHLAKGVVTSIVIYHYPQVFATLEKDILCETSLSYKRLHIWSGAM